MDRLPFGIKGDEAAAGGEVVRGDVAGRTGGWRYSGVPQLSAEREGRPAVTTCWWDELISLTVGCVDVMNSIRPFWSLVEQWTGSD